MAKRKLTRKQAWRVKKVQEEKARRVVRREEAVADTELGPEILGRVVSHFGKLVEVEPVSDHAPVRADTQDNAPKHGGNETSAMQCHFRANLGSIVTGDRVVWRRGKSGLGMIEAVLPRSSLLSRPDTRGVLKPVASNIDFIVLVITPEPAPSSLLIDRYLVAAELQGIDVKLLLNKTDLLNESNQAGINELLRIYESIGYDVLRSSVTEKAGLTQLKSHLDHRISAFVGQSGVGKSSLVNALLPGTDVKVGEISEGSKLGRHTTTNARLFHFPSGGDLIDSPGIREFGLWHLEKEAIIDGYREFRPYIGYCKFRDCRHQQEPGCALREALAKGEITQMRYDNYFTLVNSDLTG
ncbi:MAG: small ribosomal subunit biogenesis GTPase RsgA [Ketobacteraceae bacterium]|nr:small ribosomal subunit biogenesis GTPase RsgA [Ketobacteraceae bacterium]